jgi:hypothetical protein
MMLGIVEFWSQEVVLFVLVLVGTIFLQNHQPALFELIEVSLDHTSQPASIYQAIMSL